MTQDILPTERFAPCPICKQYSHSIGEDQLARAFMHFQSMFSHRGDGIPTQHTFDEATRDAAQVLMNAAKHAATARAEALEEAAKIAAATKAYDDNLQKSAGGSTTGQRIAWLIRSLIGEQGG